MLVMAPTILHAVACPGSACGRRPALCAGKIRCHIAVHSTSCPPVRAFCADPVITSPNLPVRSVRNVRSVRAETVTQQTWFNVQNKPDAVLTPTGPEIFYDQTGELDSTYSKTNTVLTR